MSRPALTTDWTYSEMIADDVKYLQGFAVTPAKPVVINGTVVPSYGFRTWLIRRNTMSADLQANALSFRIHRYDRGR